MLALFDERLGHGADGIDRAVQPHRGVDAVRQQIAGDTGAGGLHVEPPQRGAALWQVRADRPVLQKLGAVMEDATELAFVNQLLRQDHRRATAIIVPHHVRHLRLLNGGDHLFGLLRVQGERFLAQDHLA